MKTCQLCGETSPDNAETCPNDGEASWSEPVVVAPAGDEPRRSKAPKAAGK